ncbi:hypothetical protein K493DRAFT_341728 [Basidiobolus meristosporus CBS 931.73]|uniref:PHD-type domain-containing protein n=1 Tax=Basidiobolus meristosporus CBS 931.73 TaxID=1314790 RepID=A0A1Y1XJ31_9FUNG|nr:hypothetical protein K493DRAFT_341728 [Basidiobolus meristosporus CBS 931.73]|eukprot:ORX85692.1 hypothetical protein K493DRAFT_341728 [Basidiobolus meristosporus CBS 931.73]
MESARRWSNYLKKGKVHWSPELIFDSSTESSSNTESGSSGSTTSSDSELENGLVWFRTHLKCMIAHLTRFIPSTTLRICAKSNFPAAKRQHSRASPSCRITALDVDVDIYINTDTNDWFFSLRSHRNNKASREIEIVVVSDDDSSDLSHSTSSNLRTNSSAPKKTSGPDMCCICLDEDSTQSNDELVWCDGDYCEVSVHRTCYGLGPIQKNKEWYCDRCAASKDDVVLHSTCLLCPSLVGAFWRVQDVPGGWVHVVCATWIVGTDLDTARTRDKIKVSGVSSRSWNTRCSVCDEADAVQGISIKCEAGKCRNGLHVTCAYDYGLYETWQDLGATTVLCKKHTKDPVRLNVWKLWVNRRDRMLDQFPGIYCRSHYQNLDIVCIGSIQRNIAEITCENATLERSLRTLRQKSRRLEESARRFTEELQDAEQELGSLQNLLLQSFRGVQITEQQLKELELSEENVINYFLTEVTVRGFRPDVSKFLQPKQVPSSNAPMDTESITIKEEFDEQAFGEEFFGKSPSKESTEGLNTSLDSKPPTPKKRERPTVSSINSGRVLSVQTPLSYPLLETNNPERFYRGRTSNMEMQ